VAYRELNVDRRIIFTQALDFSYVTQNLKEYISTDSLNAIIVSCTTVRMTK